MVRIIVGSPTDLDALVGDEVLRDHLIAQLEALGYTVRAPGQLIPCDAIKPHTEHDVIPVRCRLPKLHRDKTHWHPPLWPATPDVVWIEEVDNDA